MFTESKLTISLKRQCEDMRLKLKEKEAEFLRSLSEDYGLGIGACVEVRVSEDWEKKEIWEKRIVTNVIVDNFGHVSFATDKDLGKGRIGMPVLWFGVESLSRVKLREKEAA